MAVSVTAIAARHVDTFGRRFLECLEDECHSVMVNVTSHQALVLLAEIRHTELDGWKVSEEPIRMG